MVDKLTGSSCIRNVSFLDDEFLRSDDHSADDQDLLV